MTFSEQLQAILAERHLTQAAAYRALQIPRRTFQNWYLGINTPPAYIQKAVLDRLRQTKKPS